MINDSYFSLKCTYGGIGVVDVRLLSNINGMFYKNHHSEYSEFYEKIKLYSSRTLIDQYIPSTLKDVYIGQKEVHGYLLGHQKTH